MRYLLLVLFLSLHFNISAQNDIEKKRITYQVSDIIIKGNSVTKEKVIYRELLFSKGNFIAKDSITELIKQSKLNLLNTSLFNYVTIEYTISDNNIKIEIILEERWYFWPYPILEHADRNFSSWLERKDLSVVNYGLHFVKYNFRGNNEILKIKTRFGYKEQYQIYYNTPNLDKKRQTGLELNFDYFRQHEIAYSTYNNIQRFVKDNNNFLLTTIRAEAKFSFRNKYYTTQTLKLSYFNNTVQDTILELNNFFFYNGTKNISYIKLKYEVNSDKRDSKVYPLNGRLLSIGGFSLIDLYKNPKLFRNYGFTGQVSFFKKLYNRIYITTDNKIKKAFKIDNSYFNNKGLGYDNYLRGYEYYVIAGNSSYISLNNLKFEIIKPTIKKLSFVPMEKFKKIHYAVYANMFFDYGYVDNKIDYGYPTLDVNTYYTYNNSLENSFLYSFGVGLDLVTYYDKILRIEFSINKMKQTGLYLHFKAPIL